MPTTEICNCEQSLTLEDKLEQANDFLFDKIGDLEVEIQKTELGPKKKIELLEVQIRCMKILKEVRRALSI